jgi:hypothetical protein
MEPVASSTFRTRAGASARPLHASAPTSHTASRRVRAFMVPTYSRRPCWCASRRSARKQSFTSRSTIASIFRGLASAPLRTNSTSGR